MFIAPASLRAGTKRMRLWRAMASRIGMLWIEITPNTVLTPISASAWATRSPTGSLIATGCGMGAASVIRESSDMPRCAARNLELRAGDEARDRRAQKGDGARDLVGLAQALHWNMPLAS